MLIILIILLFMLICCNVFSLVLLLVFFTVVIDFMSAMFLTIITILTGKIYLINKINTVKKKQSYNIK